MPLKSSHRDSRSPSRSVARKAPSARLILMVIATNQLAATDYSSVPYLATTLPPPMHLAQSAPPFEFKPLRVRLDAGKKMDQPEAELPPPDQWPSPDSTATGDPLIDNPLPFTHPVEEETTVSLDSIPPSAAESLASPPPVSSPDAIVTDANGVRLEDFLTFFPSSSKPTSRASYKKQ